MDPEEADYVHIEIQELKRKEQPEGKDVSEEELAKILNVGLDEKGKVIKKEEREVFCYMDNGLKERTFDQSNQFFLSFLIPYNQHGDILLVPDNIWLAISFFFSKYVEQNSEKLRHRFVNHLDKK